MFDLTGKTAFVSGGSSGIGLGIVRALLQAGAQVAIGYQTRGHLEHAKALLGCDADRVDGVFVEVSDRASVEAAARAVSARFGAVHIVVSNAGMFCDKDIADTTADEFARLMAVNVGGVFNCVKAFLPLLQANGAAGGHIVATSSILGLLACRTYGSYSASKFAVVGLMESLRGELADCGIAVSVYCPGSIHTNIHARMNHAARLHPIQMSDDIRFAGEAVVEGIRRDTFYILSHPQFSERIADKASCLVRSAPEAPPFALLAQDSLLGRCLKYDAL